MRRQRALDLPTLSKSEVVARFGVTWLALFGSTAHDAVTSGSDIDVLIDFDGLATHDDQCVESAIITAKSVLFIDAEEYGT